MPMSHTVLYYHIVFGTKDHAPLLGPDVAPGIHAYLRGIVEHLGGQGLAVGAHRDHVHLLVSLPAHRAVADVARDLKANSSRWVHESQPELRHFAWQDGYGAFTVDPRGLGAVRAYIAGQTEHHVEVSFRDELRRFLDAYGVAYDARYL